MKSNKFMFTILVIGLMAVFSMTASAQKSLIQDKNSDLYEQRENLILGSWKLVVTPQDVPGSPPFDHISTFAAGGGYVESSNINLGFPTIATSGHGTWKYVGGRKVAFNYLKFFFDLGGNFIGTLQVEGNYVLTSSDSVEGIARGTFTDPAGNVLFSGLASSIGTRIRSDAHILKNK